MRLKRCLKKWTALAAGPVRVLAVMVLMTLALSSASSAVVQPPAAPPVWLKAWAIPKVPDGYRSPGELHKVIVESGDRVQARILRRATFLNVYQYHRRELYLMSSEQLLKLPESERASLNIRDDLNLIRLRDRYFDTTTPVPEVSPGLRLSAKPDAQLHLVQFVGPVQRDWLDGLRLIEGLMVVTHVPENAYLVWADQPTREKLAEWADFKYYVQWHGPFHPAYKLHPGFDLDYGGDVKATIQLVTHAGVDASIAAIKAKAGRVLRDTYTVGPYTSIRVVLPASELVAIALLDDVVNVEPWTEPVLGGERQDQILANQLNAAGSQPAGPGYLTWLQGLGFGATFDFVVDVADCGIDRGRTTAANLHQDFLDAGGTSRVAYVQQVTGTTIDVTAANNNDLWGHGTIDCAIVGGFNDTPDTPGSGTDFEDGAGYQYGLGIAPFTQIGSSRIFNPGFTSPDYTELINSAYTRGARISSNSWGDRGGANGSYTDESQEYDELVRDGRPSTASDGGEAGNQEMCIVFLAGNSGPGASTLWNLGSTAKNTLVVGASENWNQIGTDGCGATNADADDARDVADFSSAGPTQDDRFKPDIMAPGTHIYGAASQDPGYTGTLVCNQYLPAGQTLYALSTGTSHSTPAVAGATALLRQGFLDAGHPAPSPAMTKAYLMNSTTYMTGARANDDLPSDDQGMGRMNLEMAFDGTPRLMFDQVKTCHRDGVADASEIFTVEGQVFDITRPFRVTLVWTDAPGNPIDADMLKNDLDLEVELDANFYRGNDFTNGTSNAGNVADPADEDNNVESVFLDANTLAPAAPTDFIVRVRPSDINSDGVPNNGDSEDQDFSLVIYNAEFPPRNPVDIILVLDRSGSMNSVAAGGTDEKIDLLKDAVEMFIRAWEPFSIAGDRMGIVYFNDGIVKYPNASVILHPFQQYANDLIQNVRAITATNCTALGGGILTAVRGFDSADSEKHIIVFTNGMQNCSPMLTKVGAVHQILDDPAPPCCDSGVPGEPGVNLADYGVKAIHTIGTGVSGADWINLIMDIAMQTGGHARFTSSPDEDMEDFFLETLVQTLRVDPTEKVKTVKGVIAKNAPPTEEAFHLNSTVRKATFALSWRGQMGEDALMVSLIAPDGTEIPGGLIRTTVGTFYRIATVTFPIDMHGTPLGPLGTWRLRITPQLSSPQVPYRVHLIVDDADLRYSFDVADANYGVGDVIPMSFWVQQGNRTLTDLTGEIKVTVTRPPVGFGTFMVKHPVSKQELEATINLSGDKFSHLAAKKAHILVQDAALRQELEPEDDTIRLYDDGRPEHGDAKAGDGVYSGLYERTKRPGFYDFELSLRGLDPMLGTIARSEMKTVSVGLKRFDLERSRIEVTEIPPIDGKAAYHVDIMLIDGFGNYLGPGHDTGVRVAPPGKKWGPMGRRVELNDNLDGSYSGRVELSEQEVDQGWQLEIDLDGQRLSEIEKPPPPRWHRGSLSIHGGYAAPSGSFANDFDPGYNVLLDVDYHFTPQIAAVGWFGYNDFKAKVSGVDDRYIINISLNLRYRRLLGGWLFAYVQAGGGLYMPEDGDSELGANAGVGLNRDHSNRITFEVGADYHSIFDPDIEFTHAHAGVILRF
jgi:hypothetical protein